MAWFPHISFVYVHVPVPKFEAAREACSGCCAGCCVVCAGCCCVVGFRQAAVCCEAADLLRCGDGAPALAGGRSFAASQHPANGTVALSLALLSVYPDTSEENTAYTEALALAGLHLGACLSTGPAAMHAFPRLTAVPGASAAASPA